MRVSWRRYESISRPWLGVRDQIGSRHPRMCVWRGVTDVKHVLTNPLGGQPGQNFVCKYLDLISISFQSHPAFILTELFLRGSGVIQLQPPRCKSFHKNISFYRLNFQNISFHNSFDWPRDLKKIAESEFIFLFALERKGENPISILNWCFPNTHSRISSSTSFILSPKRTFYKTCAPRPSTCTLTSPPSPSASLMNSGIVFSIYLSFLIIILTSLKGNVALSIPFTLTAKTAFSALCFVRFYRTPNNPWHSFI